MSRNAEVLADFIKYCNEHPDQRFWQALRNWSTYPFVYVSDNLITDTKANIEDTFYWEGKNE